MLRCKRSARWSTEKSSYRYGDRSPVVQRLQKRMHLTRPSSDTVRAVPVQLLAFDVLTIDGDSTMSLPHKDRRAHLADLHLTGTGVRTPPYWTETPLNTMLRTTHTHGLEGVL